MPKKPVPPSLVKNVAKVAERAMKNLVAEARADIALILEKKGAIAAAFYDIGEALVRLKRKGIPEALGHESYDEMCSKEFGLASGQVDELVDIVTRLTRKDAIKMGQSKATAFARLAAATPAADTPAGIYRRGVRSPSGKAVGKGSSAREINEASKEFRQAARGAHRSRGRSTMPAERDFAARVQAALHTAGVMTAKVLAVASVPGKEANLKIEGVPVSKSAVLARALKS
ncbi:hypothetical protein BH09MYX1_BH09MYX1_53050 [soil metagenome]